MQTVKSPGEIIRERLGKTRTSIEKAADSMNMLYIQLQLIVDGHLPIDEASAVKLGLFFNTTPETWIDQQTSYSLWKEKTV